MFIQEKYTLTLCFAILTINFNIYFLSFLKNIKDTNIFFRRPTVNKFTHSNCLNIHG